VLLLIAVVLLAVAAYALLVTDGSKGRGAGGAPSATDVPVNPTATAFDPFGNPPGEENNDEAANVVDGDPATVWHTEQYNNFSEKPGVGMVLDLGRQLALRSVTVDAAPPGWSGQVYLSTQPTASLTSLSDWGESTASADDVAGASHAFTFAATRAGAVLVWFTRLPAGDGGQSLQVSEISLG
jgi:putative peptidoglycan lipid II flippase